MQLFGGDERGTSLFYCSIVDGDLHVVASYN